MTVVVATDGSARSLGVLPHAARLAEALGERIALLRVLDPLVDCKGEPGLTLRQASRSVAARWLDELRATLAAAGIDGAAEVATRVHGEEIHDTLLSAATDLGATVIALDTHGAGVLRHAFLGSRAMDVLGRATVPILLTGPASEPPVISSGYELFYTSDQSAAADWSLTALGPVLAAAKPRFNLWQGVIAGSDEAARVASARAHLERLAATLAEGIEPEIAVDVVKTTGEVATRIVEKALAAGASAIAMATHGHSARYHLLAGSVALGVLKQSPLPVLMVRAREDIVPRL